MPLPRRRRPSRGARAARAIADYLARADADAATLIRKAEREAAIFLATGEAGTALVAGLAHRKSDETDYRLWVYRQLLRELAERDLRGAHRAHAPGPRRRLGAAPRAHPQAPRGVCERSTTEYFHIQAMSGVAQLGECGREADGRGGLASASRVDSSWRERGSSGRHLLKRGRG